MPKDELQKKLDERLQGWRRLPDGEIAYLDLYGSAVFPMDGLLAVAVRFDGRRKGQTGKVTEQLQFGLSPQQCRELAQQLLEGAAFIEQELTPPTDTKPN